MSSVASEVRGAISRLELNPRTVWNFNELEANKFEAGVSKKNSMEYLLRFKNSKSIHGSLTLKKETSGTSQVRVSVTVRICLQEGVTLSTIDLSVGEIREWVKQCQPYVESLNGTVKIENERLILSIPDIGVDFKDKNQPVKKILSLIVYNQIVNNQEIVNNQHVLDNIYIVSKTVLGASLGNTSANSNNSSNKRKLEVDKKNEVEKIQVDKKSESSKKQKVAPKLESIIDLSKDEPELGLKLEDSDFSEEEPELELKLEDSDSDLESTSSNASSTTSSTFCSSVFSSHQNQMAEPKFAFISNLPNFSSNQSSTSSSHHPLVFSHQSGNKAQKKGQAIAKELLVRAGDGKIVLRQALSVGAIQQLDNFKTKLRIAKLSRIASQEGYSSSISTEPASFEEQSNNNINSTPKRYSSTIPNNYITGDLNTIEMEDDSHSFTIALNDLIKIWDNSRKDPSDKTFSMIAQCSKMNDKTLESTLRSIVKEIRHDQAMKQRPRNR